MQKAWDRVQYKTKRAETNSILNTQDIKIIEYFDVLNSGETGISRQPDESMILWKNDNNHHWHRDTKWWPALVNQQFGSNISVSKGKPNRRQMNIKSAVLTAIFTTLKHSLADYYKISRISVKKPNRGVEDNDDANSNRSRPPRKPLLDPKGFSWPRVTYLSVSYEILIYGIQNSLNNRWYDK